MSTNTFKIFIVLYNDCRSFDETNDVFVAAGQTVEQAIANAIAAAEKACPGFSSMPIAYTEEESNQFSAECLEYLQVLEKTYVS
jgi:hypothetical protein